ncbi:MULTISPECIES: hypothetical protein [Pseudanabaena]|uniref:Uncharacterized protein n=2 Tax=Pseudanabaena TaxID=1152 RepID=L8N7Z0_9CYAN|nr:MULTISPECIES: hypothetical protein [Pseudanabaena]ELS34353.1 hypothetical protein Pse7429DRAFT_0390 [Pseudanabaena biceps PCC 7429]MDG3493405.1 hypothetical protein [Pseudanabaena catenata USMAC16]
MKYTNKKPLKSSLSISPTEKYLQTRPFAPPVNNTSQDDLSPKGFEDNSQRHGQEHRSENLLAKLVNMPESPNAPTNTQIQRKLKAPQLKLRSPQYQTPPHFSRHKSPPLTLDSRDRMVNHTESVIQRKRSINQVQTTNPNKEDLGSKEQDYKNSLTRGKALQDKGLAWFNKSPDATKPVTTNTTNEKIEAAGYKTFWKKGKKGKFRIATSRGAEVEGKKSSKVKDFGQIFKGFEDLGTDVMYGNTFNPTTGEFSAMGNWGDWDEEIMEKENLPPRLSNSEIIWHQQDVVRNAYKKKMGQEAKTLKSIKRSQISNKPTLNTLLFCDHWKTAEDGGKVELDDPRKDDVWALLGSPNGNSSVYILMEHGEEFGGVDITSVSYETSGDGAPPDMTISYKTE